MLPFRVTIPATVPQRSEIPSYLWVTLYTALVQLTSSFVRHVVNPEYTELDCPYLEYPPVRRNMYWLVKIVHDIQKLRLGTHTRKQTNIVLYSYIINPSLLVSRRKVGLKWSNFINCIQKAVMDWLTNRSFCDRLMCFTDCFILDWLD